VADADAVGGGGAGDKADVHADGGERGGGLGQGVAGEVRDSLRGDGADVEQDWPGGSLQGRRQAGVVDKPVPCWANEQLVMLAASSRSPRGADRVIARRGVTGYARDDPDQRCPEQSGKPVWVVDWPTAQTVWPGRLPRRRAGWSRW
jgi:hypothetical protein